MFHGVFFEIINTLNMRHYNKWYNETLLTN